MRHMAARGVAVQNLEQEELDRSDGRQHAVSPCSVAGLLARGDDGFRLQLSGPLRFESFEHGSDAGDHPFTSCIQV
jgi:hypothetical protein